MKIEHKKCLVIGMGKSGLAVAKQLKLLGAEVVISDRKHREELSRQIRELDCFDITILTGNDYNILPKDVNLVVISPGVPLETLPIQKAYENKIPVISEIELAYQLTQAPIVAITGTNGKTTTTSLIDQILKDYGFKSLIGGNIGNPLIDEVIKAGPQHIIVAEVSSFQLETIDKFKPHISIILNLTEDHIDRHGNFLNYINAKARIFENQTSVDYAVLNGDDPQVAALGAKVKQAKVVLFSQQMALEQGVWVEENKLIIANLTGQKIRVCPIKDIMIRGKHNLENALAAVTAGLLCGVSPESITYTLKSFPGVEHRLEPVAEIKGVKYINDSKGTNPDSTLKALAAYEQPLILIAGGKDKGTDFTILAKAIAQRVKHLVLIGQSAGKIENAVKKTDFKNIHWANSMAEAVKMSARLAESGDIVLLSPACASFDMFNDFEERGRVFKTEVRELRRG